jgi:hypothetical protein
MSKSQSCVRGRRCQWLPFRGGELSELGQAAWKISSCGPTQKNILPIAKSQTRSKQNKDIHKCSSVYSERGVPLPVLTSGGERVARDLYELWGRSPYTRMSVARTSH